MWPSCRSCHWEYLLLNFCPVKKKKICEIIRSSSAPNIGRCVAILWDHQHLYMSMKLFFLYCLLTSLMALQVLSVLTQDFPRMTKETNQPKQQWSLLQVSQRHWEIQNNNTLPRSTKKYRYLQVNCSKTTQPWSKQTTFALRNLVENLGLLISN